MTTVVFAAPYTPPPPPRNPWTGARLWWVGADGSEWELTAPSRTGVYLRSGVRGLTEPPFEHHTSSSAGVHGQRFRGWRAAPREVFWPLSVYEDGGDAAWLEYDAAWWASLRPDAYGEWVCEHPVTGTRRTLRLRLADGGDKAWDNAPGQRSWEQYGIYLIADDPFWAGDPVSSPVWGQGGDEVDVFGPTDVGPPMFVNAASTLATATLSNPGDVPAWLEWTVVGPTTSVTLGAGGGSIVIPFPLLEGQVASVVTDPAAGQGVWVDGARRTGDVSVWDPRPVEPGRDVALSLSMSGTGTVQASFVPRYFRAW